MSHHFDSAADRADGRINPCDLYAFPTAPGTSALILTVNPDAGRSSPTTFRPDARYEFVVACDGGTTEDIAFRVTFSEPGDTGQQQVRVLRVTVRLPARPPRAHSWARAAPGRCSPSPATDWPGLGWPRIPSPPMALPLSRSTRH